MKEKLVYVGDFGQTPISKQTLEAYSVDFLAAKDNKWRRSSKKRADVTRLYADLATVQRYFWMRDEDRGEL